MGYSVNAELFAEWAIGLLVIAVRLYARWTVGKGKFYWDDLCLGFVVVFWTFHTVFLYLCTDVYGSNIGLNEQTAAQVPDNEVEGLREGSIFAFIAWLSYIFMVWSFKGVLVFLYNRLTIGLPQHRLTIVVGVACICTFLASLFFHLFICMPVHKSWQIKPYPGDNCTLRPLNYIVIETLSVLTDIAIMCVPIPLILAARIPTAQKTALCLLFSSGIFVMIACFLRAYYSVKDINTLATALGWASREALVSVIIVCAPGIKPLFAHIGWFGSYGSSNRYENTSKSRHTIFRSRGTKDRSTIRTTDESHPYELELSTGWKKGRPCSSGESQDLIIEVSPGPKQGDGPDRGIIVTTDVMLAHEDVRSSVRL